MVITDKTCPRCDEGKLVETILTESETDFLKSTSLGIALGVGFVHTTKPVEYLIYTCDRNCGYTERKKKY